ncbi:serine/threonine-protein kinase [Paucibacter sp. R3-3]|uniref:Serine/threonine-protein kinase n=1 Tax=Roseateles agri TaxID=3098619 RepID=A0ABU5DI90_9BURK|nr:serine/threonine-protein kinase [Paucibacter sp. R3-3]MDY0745997.1 serine/threonine-protein kinase [Paucibacter sp. R3-3]
MSTESSPADDDRTQIIAPPKAPPPAPAQPTSAGHSSAGDSGNALPVGTYLAEFEINSVLGEGGFGIVYLAWDHSLERRVALKEYMPASLASRSGATQVNVKSERHRGTFEAGMKSFINEAKLLAQFDHPSLVKVYRFWEANGTAYMVMPFYEGTTLKDRLKSFGQPPDEAWLMGLLAPLTEALAVIHQERCYHRDIAPDNVILLNATGRPLLLDFGAARRVIGDMTQALTVILKPGYAPVEQYAETPNMKQGGWTDVYALAATIHFAILGRTPPPSVSRLMGDNYQPLAEAAAGRYSERFLNAIDKALRVRPEERTQTIGELRADLGLDAEMPHHAQPTQIVLRGDATGMSGDEKTQLQARPPAPKRAPSPAVSSPSAAAPAPAPSSKTPLIAGIGALVLIGGGVAAWMAMSGKKPEPAVAAAPPPISTAAAPAPAPAEAPAPAAAPATAAPTTHFDALAQFDQLLASQSPGFKVEATAEKSRLRIGKDLLSFTVKSQKDGYVNVLVYGPDGSLMLLFPNKLNVQTGHNKIKAGQTLRIPDENWVLQTFEPTGPEHFAVIVSDQPRDFAAIGAVPDDAFMKLQTGAAGDAQIARWTKPTPMLLGTPPAGCTGANCDAYGAARFTVEIVR